MRGLGVRCWLFAEHYRGSALVDRRSTSEEEEIERWVRHYDKLIVICSQAGMNSEIVQKDITEAKEQQQSKDQWLLYLVTPDSTLIDPSARAARNLTYEHLVFNLQGQDAGTEEYRKELNHLADELKQSQPAKAGLPTVSDQP